MLTTANPTVLLAVGGIIGVALALAAGIADPSDTWHDAVRDIGGGIVAGSAVGGVLHAMAERAEARRDDHNAILAATDRRHRLATELAMADDVRGKHLANQDLQGVILAGRDLSGTVFTHADLSRAHLPRAVLRGANLVSANLRDTDLRDADLSGANLTDATLAGAQLTKADFTDVDLTSTVFDGAWWQLDQDPRWPDGFAPPPNGQTLRR